MALIPRAKVDGFSGCMAEIMNGLNAILDENSEAFNAEIAVLKKMVAGDLSQRVTQEFKGDYSQIKDNFNQLAENAEKAWSEVQRLVETSRSGDLKARTKVNIFAGDWQKIMESVNFILDEALGPVNIQIDLLSKMISGDLTARITQDFKGDHNRIKDLINQYQVYNQQVVNDIVDVSQGLADNNLRVVSKAEYRGDFVKIKDALEMALNGLSDTLRQTNEVVEQVVLSVEQVTAISQDLATSSQEQSSAVEEISSNVEETDTQVKANAESANVANQLVNQTNQIANVGQEKMKMLTESMRSIAESSREISKINKVNETQYIQPNMGSATIGTSFFRTSFGGSFDEIG